MADDSDHSGRPSRSSNSRGGRGRNRRHAPKNKDARRNPRKETRRGSSRPRSGVKTNERDGRRSSQSQRHSSSRSGRWNRDHQRSPSRRRRRVQIKDLRPFALIKRYGQLWEQHEKARKRYYEMYYRGDEKRAKSYESKFVHTIELLRRFESMLIDWQVEYLKNHFVIYDLDTEYSSKNQMPLEGESPGEGPFENPHILKSQLDRQSYKDDTEESVGTSRDWENYRESKGA